jgi:hypothetical protein
MSVSVWMVVIWVSSVWKYNENFTVFLRGGLCLLANSLKPLPGPVTLCVSSLSGILEWILGKRDAEWVGFITRSVLENSTR